MTTDYLRTESQILFLEYDGQEDRHHNYQCSSCWEYRKKGDPERRPDTDGQARSATNNLNRPYPWNGRQSEATRSNSPNRLRRQWFLGIALLGCAGCTTKPCSRQTPQNSVVIFSDEHSAYISRIVKMSRDSGG